MKKIFIAASSLLLAFSISSSVMAAPSSSANLNVNGVKQVDQKPLIINQTTMVPIRALTLMRIFKVEWDGKTNSITVANSKSKETVKMTVNSKIAYQGNSKLTLDTPPKNVKGTVYVPLKFIGESLGANVVWDAGTRTAVIYNSNTEGAENSKDIVKARAAVLSLPHISLYDPIPTISESNISKYYFPYGKTQRFFVLEGDIIKYYEVKDQAAWQIWAGKLNFAKQQDDKDIISNLSQSIIQESGKRPSGSDQYVYFTDYFLGGMVDYGVVGKDGKAKELGKFNYTDRTQPFIKEIEGEKRTD
ncbi:copper amine oxidase N-terminal domain-containing protein [Paenibacillus azoreducens]|uniref:Copper amine oxidase-like N-terminal domain-containing protein n=1 Tax=Paenibacillus azoreducens TaxID=116718 RepID=A0A919YB09_9BACL|nr:copper amine oxidase N-terminal domain-containing protein [Paenibacillus azoreducens]GIO47449.1 hypothetical protein J34TS1_22140 [Paenibacillus azoreducens]